MFKRNLAVFIIYAITLFAAVPLVPIFLNLFSMDEVEAVIYGTIVSFVVGLIITYFILRKDIASERRKNEANLSRLQIILWTAFGIFLAFFSQIIANLVETTFFGVELGSENTFMIMDIARAFPLFMLIPMVVAPILEELVFRKVLYGSLYKRYNFFFAALVSAFIFGIIHGEVEHLFVYTLMGLVFAYIYYKTKRIIVPILVHISMNTITVIVQFSIDPEELKQLQSSFIHLF